MPRPIRPWFRVYVEMLHDRKLRRLTPAQRWLWVSILGAARESCEPGRLYIAPALPMSPEELGDYANLPMRDVRSGLEAMTQMSMVTVEDGLIVVTNWDHRQFESDDVTKRTRDHRERSGEPRRNVPGNAPDTETETETEKEAANKPRKRASTRFPDDWQPTDQHAQFANENGINLHVEASKFHAHAIANDRRQVSWNAAFTQWLLSDRTPRNLRVVNGEGVDDWMRR